MCPGRPSFSASSLGIARFQVKVGMFSVHNEMKYAQPANSILGVDVEFSPSINRAAHFEIVVESPRISKFASETTRFSM